MNVQYCGSLEGSSWVCLAAIEPPVTFGQLKLKRLGSMMQWVAAPELFALHARLGQGLMRTDVLLPRSAEVVFWQRNELRSSFYESIGRQMSFGVVETLPGDPQDSFQGESETSEGKFSTYSVVLTTEFHASPSRAALSSGNHYSETRFAANGDLGTTPKLDLLPVRP